jgi:lipoprotein-releasing system permease protein
MALAPVAKPGAPADAVRRATALVKGIEPTTAHEVIDVEEHLAAGVEEGVSPPPLTALTTDLALQPMPGRDDDRLPPVIADTPDPRGEGWYPKAMERWRALPKEKKFGRRRASIDEDEWPDDFEVDDNTQEDAASLPTMFVGYALARELQLSIGDVVMLVDPGASFDHTQAPEFRRYRIAGVFRAGFQEYDDHLVYIHINELQYFKYRGKDVVSGIDLRLHDPYDAPAVEAVLRETIGADEYTILEWQKLNANLFQSIRTQKTILTIILSLVGTVAGFNVLTALWTMVMRRNAEIAIVMSMGASEGGVARFFQFSGLILGAVGSLAGVAYGLVLCWLVELYGYSLDPEVYFIEELPVEYSLVQIGTVVALTMGISFVATIPPSLRAAKLRPVEGLRYE